MTAHLDELTDIARSAVQNEVAVAGRLTDLPNRDWLCRIVVAEAECRLGLPFRPNDRKALHGVADPRQAVAVRQALPEV